MSFCSKCGSEIPDGALICGIIGTVMCFFLYTSILSVVLGIVGLVLAGKAKKSGNTEGIRTAGFVMSIISIVGGGLVLLYMVVVLCFVGSIYTSTLNGIFNFTDSLLDLTDNFIDSVY